MYYSLQYITNGCITVERLKQCWKTKILRWINYNCFLRSCVFVLALSLYLRPCQPQHSLAHVTPSIKYYTPTTTLLFSHFVNHSQPLAAECMAQDNKKTGLLYLTMRQACVGQNFLSHFYEISLWKCLYTFVYTYQNAWVIFAHLKSLLSWLNYKFFVS